MAALTMLTDLTTTGSIAGAHRTLRVDAHENANPMGTPALPYVIGRLAVAPRPPELHAIRACTLKVRKPADAMLNIAAWQGDARPP